MRRWHLLKVVALASLSAFWTAAPAGTLRIHSATRVKKPPRIDGQLTEPCWRKGDWAERFACVITKSGKPDAATRARFLFDGKNLYVGIECREPSMAALRERIAAGPPGRFADEAEVFLEEDRGSGDYHQFMVDSDGSRYEGHRYDGDWTCKWQSAVRLGPDRYTVEIAIPFSSLGASAPGPGTAWGMNVCRGRSVAEPSELSCWSDTRGGFHAPNRFGLLIFAPYAEWLAGHLDEASRPLLAEMQKLCRQYPRSSATVAERVSRAGALPDRFRAELPAAIETEEAALKWYGRADALFDELGGLLQKLRLAIIAGEFR